MLKFSVFGRIFAVLIEFAMWVLLFLILRIKGFSEQLVYLYSSLPIISLQHMNVKNDRVFGGHLISSWQHIDAKNGRVFRGGGGSVDELAH